MFEFSRFQSFMFMLFMVSGMATVLVGFPVGLICGIVWVVQHVRVR